MYHEKTGHTGPGVFWERGSLQIYRHCDGVFELRCGGIQVLPIGSFEQVNKYLWLEFDVM